MTSAAARAASALPCRPDSQCQMWLFCLSGGAIRAEDERVLLEGLVRVDDDRQRLVVDEDGGDAVGGGVAGRRDDGRDFLALVHDRVGRQHHLHVAGERRHPVELVALEVLAGDDRERRPGPSAPRELSIDLIFAWAYGLRTMSSQSMPGRTRSSMYSPAPRMNRGSSLRLTEWPMPADFGGGLERLGRHLVAPRSARRSRFDASRPLRPAPTRPSPAGRTPAGSP